jgi:hypothetical protein
MRSSSMMLIWFSLTLLGCETSNRAVQGDIESARDRHSADAMYCVRKHFSGVDLRSNPTSSQIRLLNACLEQRGWLIVDPPGSPGANFSCHAIDSGRGAFITFCP